MKVEDRQSDARRATGMNSRLLGAAVGPCNVLHLSLSGPPQQDGRQVRGPNATRSGVYSRAVSYSAGRVLIPIT